MSESHATADRFVTYDELSRPDLDPARWSPARLPLPTGGEHIPLDPNAEVAVGEGEVRVTIPRFSLSHDQFQSADSPKYLVFSNRAFEVPAERGAMFAVDLAVENIGGEPADYRRGMAVFHVFDLDVSKRVFAVCGTSTRVFALHEHLPLGGGGAGETFQHVVESPYEDFDDDFTRLRACEITLDRSRSTATWHVDGHTVYETHGTVIPERVRIGFGIWTMLPIREGRGRSLDGQGMDARWPIPSTRGRRVSGVERVPRLGGTSELWRIRSWVGRCSSSHGGVMTETPHPDPPRTPGAPGPDRPLDEPDRPPDVPEPAPSPDPAPSPQPPPGEPDPGPSAGQPSPQTENPDADAMAREQSQGETARQRR